MRYSDCASESRFYGWCDLFIKDWVVCVYIYLYASFNEYIVFGLVFCGV